jgi:hypothetical protein
MRVMVWHMMSTKLYFQCRGHKKLLLTAEKATGPVLSNAGGMDEYLTVMWDHMECPKGKRECVRKWRVVIVESGQAVNT